MRNMATKKTTKKVVSKPRYSLTLKMNGEEFLVETDNLSEAIKELAPTTLLTELFVTVKAKDIMRDRYVRRDLGRRIFADEVVRDIFVHNLMLE